MLDVFTAVIFTKYISAAGLSLVFYDHLLTFSSEVSLVWKSPPSFSKYLFLFNRYLVSLSIILVVSQMLRTPLTDQDCRIIIPTLAVTALTSLGVAEILVLLRVVVLWDRDLRVAGLMIFGFIISFSTTVIFVILAILKLIGDVKALPGVPACILVKTSPLLIVAWSSPIIFECIVLASALCNALSQPRTVKMHLTRVLHRDGILFFLALTLLRLLNFGLAFYPELILLGIFFVWPLISVFLNRSLFHIRSAKILDNELQREGPLLENIDASSRPSSPHIFQTKGRVAWAE